MKILRATGLTGPLKTKRGGGGFVDFFVVKKQRTTKEKGREKRAGRAEITRAERARRKERDGVKKEREWKNSGRDWRRGWKKRERKERKRGRESERTRAGERFCSV